MLKFLRQYMKYILPVAACGLMLIFVLEGSLMKMFASGDPQKMVVGTDRTGTIHTADLVNAQSDLRVLSRLGLTPALNPDEDPALVWTLLQRDARRLGLGSSGSEVSQAMVDMQLDTEALAELAASLDTSPEYVRQVIGDFLVYLRYAQLMAGQSRLSEVALRRLMHDMLSQVQITAVRVEASRYLDKVGEPTEAQLQALFDEYKDDLAGESEPFGFGYKYPDRIKFEMLIIPASKVLEKVRADKQVREIDAVEYYEQNKQLFTDGATVKPYEGPVREQILEQLRRQKVDALAKRIYQDAQDMLYQQYRQYDLIEGYRKLPQDFQPTPLSEVAESLQKRHGILPDTRVFDEAWRGPLEVVVVPYLLGARTDTEQPYSAIDYLFSARAFKPESSNPLAALRLQAKVPSLPLVSYDGSLVMVRLRDTSPSHEPQSLDEVRDAVVTDARNKAAYEALLADRTTWEERWREAEPAALAEELNTSVYRPQPFGRLAQDYGAGGGMAAPFLPIIGQDQAFVDTVCDLADQYQPTSKPRVVIEVPSTSSLFLVEVSSVMPGQKALYDQYVKFGYADMMAEGMLLSGTVDANPLSLEAIAERTGYESATAEEEASTAAPEM